MAKKKQETPETEPTDKILKLEVGFDEQAIKVLEEMKRASQTESTERVLYDALRFYDWYLREGRAYPLYQKRGKQWVRLILKL